MYEFHVILIKKLPAKYEEDLVMLKKISIVLFLMLTFILSGCNDDELAVNSQIEIRVIEDFEALGLEMPPYLWISFDEASFGREFHEILFAGQSLKVSNGLTDEIEAVHEINAGRYIEWLHTVEDYYVVKVISNDNDDPWTPTAIEILILDKSLNVVEIFNHSKENDILFSGYSLLQQLRIERNEAGEWLVFFIENIWSVDYTRIFTYNLNASELTSFLELDAEKDVLFFIPNTNQLLFRITHWIGNNERIDYVEYGVLNWETLEVEMIPRSITDNGSWVRTSLADKYLVFVSTQWVDEDGLVVEGELLIQLHEDEETILTLEIETAFLFHLPIGTYRTISLEDYRVSDVLATDGHLLFTASLEPTDGHLLNIISRVMIHDIQTGELLFEHALINANLGEDEALEGIEFLNLADDIYLIRAHIQTGIIEENLLPTGRRTEYIVIEVEVFDDE